LPAAIQKCVSEWLSLCANMFAHTTAKTPSERIYVALIGNHYFSRLENFAISIDDVLYRQLMIVYLRFCLFRDFTFESI